MKNKKEKIERDPVVMVLAVVAGLIGLGILTASIAYFDVSVWLAWTVCAASGASTLIFSLMTIVTGRREWLLINLILPG